MAEVTMLAYDGTRPSYSLDEENSFTITVGQVTARVFYSPFKADTKTVGHHPFNSLWQ